MALSDVSETRSVGEPFGRGTRISGWLGRTVVDIDERTTFLEEVKRCQFGLVLGDPFQEGDHLRSG